MLLFWLLALTCFYSCEKPAIEVTSPEISYNWQKINSRDNGDPSTRYPLYIARIPSDWTRKDPPVKESVSDTTKPLCEFIIKEENEEVHIFVHNFPSQGAEQRIPPQAQIQRWQGQFKSIAPASFLATPVSQGGFIGLCVQCEGDFKGDSQKLLGWAMQLAPEYFRQLNQSDLYELQQKRADYTIKAFGPPKFVDKHIDSIQEFASSFGLLEELPSPL